MTTIVHIPGDRGQLALEARRTVPDYAAQSRHDPVAYVTDEVVATQRELEQRAKVLQDSEGWLPGPILTSTQRVGLAGTTICCRMELERP